MPSLSDILNAGNRSYQPRKAGVDRERARREAKERIGGYNKETGKYESSLTKTVKQSAKRGSGGVGGAAAMMSGRNPAAPVPKTEAPTPKSEQTPEALVPENPGLDEFLTDKGIDQTPASTPKQRKEVADRYRTLGTGTVVGNGSNPGARDTIAPEGSPIEELTYDRFMADIGNKMGLKVRNPFLSQEFPGTKEFGSQFGLDSSKFDAAPDGAGGFNAPEYVMIDGRPAKFKAEGEMKAMTEAELESERQLTPGKELVVGEDGYYGGGLSASSRAFLDAKDSLTGLRRAEAERGIIYQGQQHYARDPESETGLRKISRGAAQDVRFGSSMTDAISNNPLISAAKGKAQARSEQTNDTLDVADPAAGQNPVVKGEDGSSEVIDNQGAMKGASLIGNLQGKLYLQGEAKKKAGGIAPLNLDSFRNY